MKELMYNLVTCFDQSMALKKLDFIRGSRDQERNISSP